MLHAWVLENCIRDLAGKPEGTQLLARIRHGWKGNDTRQAMYYDITFQVCVRATIVAVDEQ